jgi:hypothetical protein
MLGSFLPVFPSLILQGASILLSTMAVLIYIPTNSVQGEETIFNLTFFLGIPLWRIEEEFAEESEDISPGHQFAMRLKASCLQNCHEGSRKQSVLEN